MSEAALHKPRLATGVRLHWDSVRERHVLLYPEGALVLNSTAAEVLELCDGDRTVEAITEELNDRYEGGAVSEDVERLLAGIAAHGLVIDADS